MAEKDTRYAGRIEQTGVYLGKLFRILISEKGWKVLPMAGIIAAMVSYVVGKKMFISMEGTKIGALAFVCVCIWNGFFNSIQAVCKERSVLKREHRSGLHMSSYIMAQIIYQAFLCFFQVLISMLVYKLMGVKFPNGGVVTGNFLIDMSITFFLITYAADMLALMVSCLVKTTTAAMTVMPFLLIVQLVFAGVAFPLSGFPAKISNASISKWGVYAVCTEGNYNDLPTTLINKQWNLMKDSDIINGVRKAFSGFSEEEREKLWYSIYDQLMKTVHEKLQITQYDAKISNVLKEWGILLAFAILYASIGMIALEFIDRDHR